ncbi:MAG: class I SAM-dependent methyltransferase [Actinomycetota bacterium]|nr:class I SAM-dependent methyltransferase [Actinomycetota bacterium]
MDPVQRFISGAYSFLADRLYEPLVVHGGFKLFGGDINSLAFEQGRDAVAAADGGPILDMPVGTAYFTREIARKHPGIVVGVDIAQGMVEQTSRVAREDRLENLLAVRADAHRLPFDDGSFAAVISTNGLQVIPQMESAVAELVRVLGPGGTLFVSIITAPFASPLPEHVRRDMPAIVRPGRDVARAISRASEEGMTHVELSRSRLATLLEWKKPSTRTL